MTEEQKRQVGCKLDIVIYRQIRALTLLQGRSTGELIDEACKDYLAKHKIVVKTEFKRTS